MLQTLPLAPSDATCIGKIFSMATVDGVTYYFANLLPEDCHLADDVRARNLRIARYHVISGVSQVDLVDAFGVSLSTVGRAVSLFRKGGSAAFHEPPRRRGRAVIDADMAKRAGKMLDEGMSGRAAAAALGIHPATFHENLRAGVIERAAKDEGAPPRAASDRAGRDARDKRAPMGRAAHNVGDRLLASAGLLDEVEPTFSAPAGAVARGGVLAALPTLLDEGLLGAAMRLFRLPRGYYGLTTILLFLAFMTLARVRNPEALRYQPPGEWGLLLGLDRCPEVKTLRRKIKLLAASETAVRDWQAELAEAWAARDPEAVATLAVDGHVKVYAGRKGRLAKHFVARQKLCLPATASYWVNALGGAPLLCLHKRLDPAMVKAIENDVVPELRRIGALAEDAPDLTAPRPGAPALTLVFDREGWSPALFKRLARIGVAVITWHKNFKGEDWPEQDFRTFDAPIHGPAGTTGSAVALAEKAVILNNGLKVRQIRRRLDNGRQAPLITTHPTLPIEEVAGAMFSRWAQENFFKYMREEFNFDALTVHEIEPLDPDAAVVNPLRRQLDKAVRNTASRLARLRNRLADALKAGRKNTDDLDRQVANLDDELDAIKQKRAETPTHLSAGELPENQKLDTLPVSERMFLTLIRMIAYRAETRMMPAVCAAQGRKPNPRKLLRALLSSDANIIPDHNAGTLTVQILGLANASLDNALAPLIDELNRTRTIYPGTSLRLVYQLAGEIPPNPSSGIG